MTAYQVKVNYGHEKFCVFLIEQISFEKLMDEIKRHCSSLTHLSNASIRVKYRDDDGDMINLSDDAFGFSDMLRSSKEIKDRDYKKIFLQASEIDSPLPRKTKIRRIDKDETPNGRQLVQPKQLSFTTPSTNTASSQSAQSSPLDAQRKELEGSLQILKVQVVSAKDELQKLNNIAKNYQSLSNVRSRLCSICHLSGHTKSSCSNPPCTDIDICKIKEKHPEYKNKISQLQRDIKALENKVQEEETHLKSFDASRERAKSSFFSIMRPRLRAQNPMKYVNRNLLDKDLMILQRALKKVPDWDESEDWRLPAIIQQYENANVNMYHVV